MEMWCSYCSLFNCVLNVQVFPVFSSRRLFEFSIVLSTINMVLIKQVLSTILLFAFLVESKSEAVRGRYVWRKVVANDERNFEQGIDIFPHELSWATIDLPSLLVPSEAVAICHMALTTPQLISESSVVHMDLCCLFYMVLIHVLSSTIDINYYSSLLLWYAPPLFRHGSSK